VFEHFYPDCFAGDIGVSTHYVVIAHRIDVPAGFEVPGIDAQHRSLRWWPLAEAAASDAVHRYTRDYLPLLADLQARRLVGLAVMGHRKHPAMRGERL
jgi:colanic acid biosynthesis protein WcaH